ncbi:hypothetical protein PYW07_007274 [Mythimna separata]|uniref:Uncharacterized protein n=1 Tax=Mythimna separata TaxID=271217 RepID=A0AAD8DZT7_MYTSE|nr:hypothetical protein PYW07_007274 [Mythimna separata]
MPFGYECRSRIMKQVPVKPTVRTGTISQETASPSPQAYEVPELCGGKGFSKIKRAPAYTFGKVLAPHFPPPLKSNAPMIDVSGIHSKLGTHKIPGGLMTPPNSLPDGRFKVPGPGAHDPPLKFRVKRAPAYSLRLAAKPPYQPYDMWTPPPNMYCPPIPRPRAPAYSFRDPYLILKPFNTPGPGEHNPKHKYVQRTKPAFALGPRFRPRIGLVTPAPNTYCEKKFMVVKPSIPAPSFGIRHSPYIGVPKTLEKPPNIEQRMSQI